MSRLSALVGALTVLAVQASALAHSTLDHSEPKEGAALKASPNEVRMWFTEPIKVGLSTIEVRSETGKQVDQCDLRVDQNQPALLHLSVLPKLVPGTYRVSWTVVAQDMHASKGAFNFRIAPERNQ